MSHKKAQKTKHFGLLVPLCGLILAGCAIKDPVKSVKVAPPPVPILELQHVEPVEAAVSGQLAQINFNDPVDLAVLQAQLRFDKGEDLYKQGFLKRAKDEFNSAIDLVLETSESYQKEPKLQ